MELATIAWIRNRYMDTPLLSAAFQVVVGGVLVFAVGYGLEAREELAFDRVLGRARLQSCH